ncbi:uncharacterized protein LOC123883762 [Trifolium pratense]|uniref:uncharacterized protein LOC123883762 n=1 Tax=Trifolium pratense TaxID=57577 RepID=UPI001E6951E2|nr:uncharacterized protein LOC123883762 [Trifolium pratense]
MKENNEESSNGIETTPPMTQLCQKSSKGKEPITQLSQPSSMLRAATMLKDINNTKELWKIAVKVKDIWQVVKDGKESFELVVVDSKVVDVLSSTSFEVFWSFLAKRCF